MIYTDTDSLIIEVKTTDIVEDIKTMKQHFDFSDYPVDHPLYSTEHKN